MLFSVVWNTWTSYLIHFCNAQWMSCIVPSVPHGFYVLFIIWIYNDFFVHIVFAHYKVQHSIFNRRIKVKKCHRLFLELICIVFIFNLYYCLKCHNWSSDDCSIRPFFHVVKANNFSPFLKFENNQMIIWLLWRSIRNLSRLK